MQKERVRELSVTSTIVNRRGTSMRIGLLYIVLFFTTLTPSVAAGIEELLAKASAVVEGAIMQSHVTDSTTTLQIEISAVLVGSVRRRDTLAVECNSLKYVFQGVNPQPWLYPQILFLRSTGPGAWACVPVHMRGYAALGFLSYPQAPPCAEGNLQALGPKSVRERILARVAESALCGARPSWPRILEASLPWLNPLGSPGSPPLNDRSDFDRRMFRELVKSPRRDIHIEAFQGLIQLGDPFPFDLLTKDHREYQNNGLEWVKICDTIEGSLNDPSIIPQLAKLLSIREAALQLATVTALQRFHTPAAVVLLGKMLASQNIERPLALVAAKGLAGFANGCPMTTQNSFRTPADYFPRCDEKAAFRTDETITNTAPRMGVIGDDDWHINFWRNWWLTNGVRVAALVAQ